MFAVLAVSGCVAVEGGSDPAETDVTEDPGGQASPSSGEEENVMVVTYTSSGFSPATVNVDVGETVVWRSKTSTPMWVASDRHPVHSKYSGSSLSEHCGGGGGSSFDQCSSGETYRFTFEKDGTWGYHNHEYASHTGKVVVE